MKNADWNQDVFKVRRLGGVFACFALLSGGAFFLQAAVVDSPRERVSLNADWCFQREDPPEVQGSLAFEKVRDQVGATGAELVLFPPKKTAAQLALSTGDGLGADVSYTRGDFNDAGWRKLNLPHDWAIEGPFKQEYPGETGKLPWWGIGWYRKHFEPPAADSGKRIFLDLDGAMSHALVWLNGHFVGGWPYGYTSFRLDLTPYVKCGGENVLAIRLDNPRDSSRWYPGGGIYRNVWLVKTAPVHVAHWGVSITTPQVSAETAVVNVDVTLENQTAEVAPVRLVTRIHVITTDGLRSADPVATSVALDEKMAAGRQALVTFSLMVPRPALWSLKKRNLYVAVVTVEQGGKVVDRHETVFGIRTIAFDAGKGFFLNGERVPIQGVCDHHDLGSLGTALNLRALQRQIELLQEMGCNAIRTSHNPPAPELLELCDRMGMLVMDEPFDCWQMGKKAGDYGNLFDDWHEKDLRAMVRRDRNHPSVILWSIGNEVREQGRPEGWKLAAHLADMVRSEDRTRCITVGCNSTASGYNGFQRAVDVLGYNYKPGEYARFHERNPQVPVMGSETSSCVSSRGEYFFPVGEDKAGGRADFQMSSYDLYAPRWAFPPDVEFKGLDMNPFVAGEFVWTGFDYLGEPTPYNADTTNILNFSSASEQARAAKELQELGKIKVPSRSSYFGIIDLAGFKKDRFFIYQARWRPELPMVHILPHWNWLDRVGEITPVHVYTSGDEVELFLNGQSLGRKKLQPLEYRLRWDDVKYAPGELKAVAYKRGQKWSEAIVKTTGSATRLSLQPDRATIAADGQDLSFVTVTLVDKDGLAVPRSKNRIHFTLEGPGEIVATDNGDATDFTSFQSHERNAFNSLCLVIVRAKPGAGGSITLKAQADGLAASSAIITSTSTKP